MVRSTVSGSKQGTKGSCRLKKMVKRVIIWDWGRHIGNRVIRDKPCNDGSLAGLCKLDKD